MEHKQYLAACAATNQKPMQLSDFNIYPEEDRISKFALHRIETVIKADNLTSNNGQPHVKDWKNSGQFTWFPWYESVEDDSRPSGVGFSFCASLCAFSYSDVGSRLGCYSSERVEAIFKTEEMIETFNEYMGV